MNYLFWGSIFMMPQNNLRDKKFKILMTYELSINKINTFSESLANARKQNLIIEPIPNNICKIQS